eukprot:1709767-Prymnesium_polylepis.1
MQGGGEAQAGASGTATPACGARGGRLLFAAFARLCTPRAKRTGNGALGVRRRLRAAECLGPIRTRESPIARGV